MRGRRSAHLSLMMLPLTSTWSSGVILSPNCAVLPLTVTQPLLIQSSISRREPTPEAASTFCRRSGSMRDKSLRRSFKSRARSMILRFGLRTTSFLALAACCFGASVRFSKRFDVLFSDGLCTAARPDAGFSDGLFAFAAVFSDGLRLFFGLADTPSRHCRLLIVFWVIMFSNPPDGGFFCGLRGRGW